MMAETSRRSVRVDDTLWGKAQRKAAELDTDVSTVIRDALIEYVGQQPTMADSL